MCEYYWLKWMIDADDWLTVWLMCITRLVKLTLWKIRYDSWNHQATMVRFFSAFLSNPRLSWSHRSTLCDCVVCDPESTEFSVPMSSTYSWMKPSYLCTWIIDRNTLESVSDFFFSNRLLCPRRSNHGDRCSYFLLKTLSLL